MNAEHTEEYLELRLEIPRQHADAVCDFIIENIAGGLVLEDEDDSPVTGIQFYVEAERGESAKRLLGDYLERIFQGTGVASPKLSEKRIKNVEWIEEYKASIKPSKIGDDVVVRPQWHAADPTARYDIIVEPRMAFGTGSHETTRSCLKIIRERFQPGMRFLDLGTGSGILSILASKMGASYIKAIDYDLAAVQNARENCAINSVATPCEVLFGSVEKCESDTPYDMVCANIIKSTILPMLPKMIALTAPGGILILSGLLQQDEEEVTAALASIGQSDFTILPDNKWLTYTVRKR